MQLKFLKVFKYYEISTYNVKPEKKDRSFYVCDITVNYLKCHFRCTIIVQFIKLISVVVYELFCADLRYLIGATGLPATLRS